MGQVTSSANTGPVRAFVHASVLACLCTRMCVMLLKVYIEHIKRYCIQTVIKSD